MRVTQDDAGGWSVDGYDHKGQRTRRRGLPADQALKVVRGITFLRHAQDWLTLGAVEWKGGERGCTYRGYEQVLRVHLVPAFGPRPLGSITLRDVELFRANLLKTHSPKTVINICSVLSAIYRKARAWRLVAENPCEGLRSPKVPLQDYTWWSVEEAERAIQVLARGGPDFWRWSQAFFVVALRTGLRLGELAALEWRDVDLERGLLLVRRSWSNKHLSTPKSGRPREAPIWSDVAQVLMRLGRSSSGLVFEHRGQRLTQRVCVRQLELLCRKAEVPRIRLHDLRHTFASHLVAAGVTLPVVRELLGHSEIRTTMRYAHLAPQMAHQLARPAIERYWSGVRCNTSDASL